ncbi:uncharacterized protein E5676_scaffold291G00440 [Cucumis melo var. makuwa]|nr:uncharacterized protein E6C27_scaffold171G00440 [Cucumis melo var. makuwa]TYK20783.1 uncharacterized protein E5676_scaffold291G00440 [Cucumis melo var. makuwa]
MDLNPPLCCLCGDVGFPANLFRCTNCSNRFQHSYCSNYYSGESGDAIIRVCDWCRSEQRTRRPAAFATTTSQKDRKITEIRSSAAGLPSPRPAPRRYKLLKDVMC